MFAFLSFGFWFDITPVRMGGMFFTAFLLLFLATFFAGSVARIVRKGEHQEKRKRNLLSYVSVQSSLLGVFGFWWLFCSYEEVPFFGARFWILLWAGWSILAILLAKKRFAIVGTDAEKTAKRERAEMQRKYMPRKRK